MLVRYVKDNWKIILSIVLLTTITFYLSIFFERRDAFWSNVFVCLATGFIGVAITIFILQRLVDDRDALRGIGPKTLAYKKINLWMSDVIWMWRNIYQSCSVHAEPATVREFFSQKTFEIIWLNLNLDAPHQTFDVQTREFIAKMAPIADLNEVQMWLDISSNIGKIIKDGNEIINKYNLYIEPPIFAAIVELIESRFFSCLKDLPLFHQQYLVRENLPENFDKRPLLRNWSGCFPDVNDLKCLLDIHYWVESKFNFYERFDSKISRDQKYKNFRYEKNYLGEEKPMRRIDLNLVHGDVQPIIVGTL